jgi:translation initiation factor IF-2
MENTNEAKKNRPPIVTVMGHVDHGKTSILDAIRDTTVQVKEYGGITQHIGAYQIEHNNNLITFIDTPGHAAFTQMRARGGKAADIVVLVVAANEGVQPQTKEAISHSKASGAQIIVAFNKMDLPGANIQKCKQELAQENVLLEDWGGDIISVEVSAKTGKNLDKLLDAILTLAEVMDIKGDETSELEAMIIESKVDRKRGVVVSCIVRNGLLRVGDTVTASGNKAKIRSLMDDKGNMLKEAGLSKPVEVLGFKVVPNVGDLVVYEGSELTELSIDEDKQEIIGKDAKKAIGIILKADTQGTLEAVKASLADLVSSSVGSSFAIKFVHSATGEVSESDVMLAESTKGLILGFNVRIPPNVKEYAQSQNVKIRSYKAIYELIDEAVEVLEGSAKTEEEKIKGRAQVVKLFKLPSEDVIAGCKVLAGVLKNNNRVSFYDMDPADVKEDDIPLYTGKIKKLKKGKDDIDLVGKDNECGVLLKPHFKDLAVNMWLEVL